LKSDLSILGVLNFDFTYSWPMNQDEVEIFTLKLLDYRQTGLFGLLVALLGWCYFTGYVELFSIDV
jgi:hypothetical protein